MYLYQRRPPQQLPVSALDLERVVLVGMGMTMGAQVGMNILLGPVKALDPRIMRHRFSRLGLKDIICLGLAKPQRPWWDRSHSSGAISSTKGSMNNNRVTNSAGEGSGSSNSHSNATKSGDQTARVPMMTISIPKLKLNDRSAPPSRSTTPKSFEKGFIERLRGGRSSTQGTIQGSPSTAVSTTPASSSYYPTYSTFPAQSSLLNPPLPLPDAPLEPPVLPFLQAPLPLPSPALTDDSRIAYTDGLLNPVHSTHAGEASANPVLHAGNDSSLSLGDHVDYSRPFGGFVFNRMDSSTTFTSADTRTTHPAVETPLYQQQPTDHSARNESFITHIAVDQGSYFPAG
ncbi:hypothetical protein DFH05DRAFT_1463450 [Lentinula detonsa]|uniref:Uncharacterized protein n=1 Tax=Lentinula detonsa TaxID=2804962 RepID=A0A9W8TTZ8_9AGAR|nr:hypothetical protein DFH05DRAFT_1463450 [Lentinula detonsa]